MLDNYPNSVIDTDREAGKSILDFYKKAVHMDYKPDGSPLTLADKAAHSLIVGCLVLRGIPCASEEGSDLQLDARRYWLIDPLDGTKDFLAV